VKRRCEVRIELIQLRLGCIDSVVCGGVDDCDDEDAWNFSLFISKEFLSI